MGKLGDGAGSNVSVCLSLAIAENGLGLHISKTLVALSQTIHPTHSPCLSESPQGESPTSQDPPSKLGPPPSGPPHSGDSRQRLLRLPRNPTPVSTPALVLPSSVVLPSGFSPPTLTPQSLLEPHSSPVPNPPRLLPTLFLPRKTTSR